MTTFALAAALVLSLSTSAALAGTVGPPAAALSPYTATRLGHKPRNVRTAHCERKADSVGVQGRPRSIYMRKCMNG